MWYRSADTAAKRLDELSISALRRLRNSWLNSYSLAQHEFFLCIEAELIYSQSRVD